MYGINSTIFATVWCWFGLFVRAGSTMAVFLWQFIVVAVAVGCAGIVIVGLVGAKLLAPFGKGLDVDWSLAWFCKYSFVIRRSIFSAHHAGVVVVSFDRP